MDHQEDRGALFGRMPPSSISIVSRPDRAASLVGLRQDLRATETVPGEQSGLQSRGMRSLAGALARDAAPGAPRRWPPDTQGLRLGAPSRIPAWWGETWRDASGRHGGHTAAVPGLRGYAAPDQRGRRTEVRPESSPLGGCAGGFFGATSTTCLVARNWRGTSAGTAVVLGSFLSSVSCGDASGSRSTPRRGGRDPASGSSRTTTHRNAKVRVRRTNWVPTSASTGSVPELTWRRRLIRFPFEPEGSGEVSRSGAVRLGWWTWRSQGPVKEPGRRSGNRGQSTVPLCGPRIEWNI